MNHIKTTNKNRFGREVIFPNPIGKIQFDNEGVAGPFPDDKLKFLLQYDPQSEVFNKETSANQGDSDEASDDEASLSRANLEKMTVAQIHELLEAAEIDPSDYKNLKKPELIDFTLSIL